jgi:hypothetical protein
MNYVLVAALSAALMASVIALAREVRLRRALQHLLSRILSRWRTNAFETRDPNPLDNFVDSDKRL